MSGSDAAARGWAARAAPQLAKAAAPANERVSPQGSVEAQCGLVLNGQGGVIRRGKSPSLLFHILSLPLSAAAPEADTTRQRADRQTRSSLVCCQHAAAAQPAARAPDCLSLSARASQLKCQQSHGVCVEISPVSQLEFGGKDAPYKCLTAHLNMLV